MFVKCFEDEQHFMSFKYDYHMLSESFWNAEDWKELARLLCLNVFTYKLLPQFININVR